MDIVEPEGSRRYKLRKNKLGVVQDIELEGQNIEVVRKSVAAHKLAEHMQVRNKGDNNY